jgi:hypothetical protein
VTARRALLASLAAAVPLAGCGTTDDTRQSQAVVARFYDAIRRDDGRVACAQMSLELQEQLEGQTDQACSDAVTQLSLEGEAIVRTQVFATNAKVDLRSGESAFLSREREGWRLTAIGCDPLEKPRDRPFDCEVAA